MSVDLPVCSIVFGSVTPPQGDVLDLRVHLGCTNEVSSFECLLQNFNKKYSPGGSYPINVGSEGRVYIGRGSNNPLIMHLRVEEIRAESNPIENYLRVSGRCWGERLFRRVLTKKYENQKGEAIVKDLIDYFVGLSHVRDTTELIENTDTTYTLLEYENTPVFDIVKYIAGSADKAGVLGYDFRVEPDGKFAFFPRNSKTSPVSLSERIEVSEYRKDIHRVRNKIHVKGAAEAPYPRQIDDWTDGSFRLTGEYLTEEWHNQTSYKLVGTITLVPGFGKKIKMKDYWYALIHYQHEIECRVTGGTGYWRVTYQEEGGTEQILLNEQSFTNTAYEVKKFDYAKLFGYEKTVYIRFYTRVNDAANTVYSKNQRVRYYKIKGNWYETGNGDITLNSERYKEGTCSLQCSRDPAGLIQFGITFPAVDCYRNYQRLKFWLELSSQKDVQIRICDGSAYFEYVYKPSTSGAGNWMAVDLALGKQAGDEWTKSGSPRWSNIDKIEFVIYDLLAIMIECLRFDKGRWEATREDTTSQNNYGLRELVEVDEELHSDSECDLRAKALLDHLKDPAEFLTLRSTVIDYGTTPLLPGDKIHVTLPNENVDADFRIISVEYRVNAATQTLEITLELGKETPLLADYLYALRSKTGSLARYKIGRI